MGARRRTSSEINSIIEETAPAEPNTNSSPSLGKYKAHEDHEASSGNLHKVKRTGTGLRKAMGIPDGSSFQHSPFTVANQLLTIFSSWISILLPFVPAGFVAKYANLSPTTSFALNFLAIFPLNYISGLAMDEVMLRVGDNLGVLIYMTFGFVQSRLEHTSASMTNISKFFRNVVQLVTSILLLKTRQIDILKTSLIGGILSGVLLITGSSYVAGGLFCHRREQYFNQTVAQTIVNFLALSVASLIMPTASHIFTSSTAEKIAAQSRGTSIVLLVAYAFYLYMQLRTHRSLFGLKDENEVRIPKAHSSLIELI
jgi:Ca2+:H+ antiporter